MGQNLKTRLNRYRNREKLVVKEVAISEAAGFSEACWPGWVEAGFRTLKRELSCVLSFSLPKVFSSALPILVPDVLSLGRLPSAGELLFFDLETTGLSGGAGTVAFLAAFGRFDVSASKDNARLVITQYLLLDYPGENDFVEKMVSEISRKESGDKPLVVSYNGKSFDSQILNTRCLMNGIRLPEYYHADLLHPARRLWKRELPDCSQSTIEVFILGLDRTGDVSGAMAPEIWFSFLRSGDNQELFRVCDHNTKDISGLACLFLAMEEIAAEPLESQDRFRFNEEALAFAWRKTVKKNQNFFEQNESFLKCKKTGELLLENAAQRGSPLAAIVLAKNAEWHLRDFKLALRYTELALANHEIPGSFREELERRFERLEKKLKK